MRHTTVPTQAGLNTYERAADGRRKMSRHAVHAWLRPAGACDMHMRANRRCHMPLPCAAAMPRRKSSTSSGSSGSEDSSTGRRQQDHLEALLAEQPMSWMSSPGARPRPEPFSSAHADHVEQRLHAVVGEDEHVQHGPHA